MTIEESDITDISAAEHNDVASYLATNNKVRQLVRKGNVLH